jgi:hypothetical protein
LILNPENVYHDRDEVVTCVNPSRKMPRWPLKIGYDRFLFHSCKLHISVILVSFVSGLVTLILVNKGKVIPVVN